MTSVVPVSHTPLTQNDITRLPQKAVNFQNRAENTQNEDTYSSQTKKSSGLAKTVFGLVVLAAVLVGLKHWGKDSFMKIADPENMKWYDHIKKYAGIAADYIEKPFLWLYKKCGGKLEEATA